MNIKLELEKKTIVETEKGEKEKVELVVKKFSTIRMRGRALKRMLEIQDVFKSAEENNSFTQEHYELMTEFIAEMFGNQFTADELIDGMDLEDIYPTFNKIAEEISEKTMKKMDKILKK